MNADDVVMLSDSIEGVQWSIEGVCEWGQKSGVDLGWEKCNMLLWRGMEEGKAPHQKTCQALARL